MGAVVRVQSASGRQSNAVRSGSSYCSQNDPALTFSIGANVRIDRAIVEWPAVRQEFHKSRSTASRGEVHTGSRDAPPDRRHECGFTSISVTLRKMMYDQLRYAAAVCQTDLPNPRNRSEMRYNTDRILEMIDAAVIGSLPFLAIRLVVFPEFAHAAPVYPTV